MEFLGTDKGHASAQNIRSVHSPTTPNLHRTLTLPKQLCGTCLCRDNQLHPRFFRGLQSQRHEMPLHLPNAILRGGRAKSRQVPSHHLLQSAILLSGIKQSIRRGRVPLGQLVRFRPVLNNERGADFLEVQPSEGLRHGPQTAAIDSQGGKPFIDEVPALLVGCGY